MNKSTFTKRKVMIWLASGAAVLGLSVGITNIASAADQPDTKAAVETPLEGDIADQVTAAALEVEPGATVDRVETDDTYAYEAHITLEDGTHKVLFFDENFEFQGEALPTDGGQGRGHHDGGRHGGGHGPHGGPHFNGTPLEGDIADQVTAAALEAAPGATVKLVVAGDTYAYEAHVLLEDGTHKVLFFDENFELQGEETLPAHGGPGGCDHSDDMPAESTTTTIS